jgi:hypothetical protein
MPTPGSFSSDPLTSRNSDDVGDRICGLSSEKVCLGRGGSGFRFSSVTGCREESDDTLGEVLSPRSLDIDLLGVPDSEGSGVKDLDRSFDDDRGGCNIPASVFKLELRP